VYSIAVRRGAFALALAAALAAILAVAARDAFAANASVGINNFAFAPGSVTVNVGDTVTFTNNQAGIPHTATSDTPGIFDSGAIGGGSSFTSQPLNTPGTYTYHCEIHPSMTGTVIVAGAQAATATAAPPTPTTAPAATATTAAATATATSPAATATSPSASASPTAAAASTTTATAAATTGGATTTAQVTPAAPATGEDDDDDGGSSTTLIVLLVVAAIAAVGGIGAWTMLRRS
jgi:plastocyanin